MATGPKEIHRRVLPVELGQCRSNGHGGLLGDESVPDVLSDADGDDVPTATGKFDPGFGLE